MEGFTEKSRACTKDGFFKTGDQARIDDLIIAHRDVEGVAVIGMSDGELVEKYVLKFNLRF